MAITLMRIDADTTATKFPGRINYKIEVAACVRNMSQLSDRLALYQLALRAISTRKVGMQASCV